MAPSLAAQASSPADLLAWAGEACPFARQGIPKGLCLGDVTPAAQAFVAAMALEVHGGRAWVIVPDLRRQENVFNDLATWIDPGRLCFFPQFETPAFEEVLPDPELVAERLAILHQLADREAAAPLIVVLVASSLDEDVPHLADLASQELRLVKGRPASP